MHGLIVFSSALLLYYIKYALHVYRCVYVRWVDNNTICGLSLFWPCLTLHTSTVLAQTITDSIVWRPLALQSTANMYLLPSSRKASHADSKPGPICVLSHLVEKRAMWTPSHAASMCSLPIQLRTVAWDDEWSSDPNNHLSAWNISMCKTIVNDYNQVIQ